MVNDAAIIKESTNENNTDVDRWTDARRLRINGKRCSKPVAKPNSYRNTNLKGRRRGYENMSLFIRVAAISNGGLCCRGTKKRNDDHDDARSDHDGSWRE